MRRFPLRTLLLMALALVAFVRLYSITHRGTRPNAPQAASSGPQAVDVTPVSGQGCRTLDRSLEAVLRAPTDATVLTRAREALDACPEPPARACELGPALEARFPLGAEAAAPRALLTRLCQRCPAASNPCARYVVRSMMSLVAGGSPDAARLTWHLENAGTGTPAACAEVVRFLLVPAALASETLSPPHQALLGPLAAPCARAGQLPPAVLHAAVVQGGVPALAALVQVPPPVEGAVLKPERIVGDPGGARAFDGEASTEVKLSVQAGAPRWKKDGALSAVFEPPVRELTALRVRARGPGSLLAAVRVEDELGLSDPDSKSHFVLPRVCRFQGTGAWETCVLPVPLLAVEALSIFPEKDTIALSNVEVRGTR